jgi:hypothetical protein
MGLRYYWLIIVKRMGISSRNERRTPMCVLVVVVYFFIVERDFHVRSQSRAVQIPHFLHLNELKSLNEVHGNFHR